MAADTTGKHSGLPPEDCRPSRCVTVALSVCVRGLEASSEVDLFGLPPYVNSGACQGASVKRAAEPRGDGSRALPSPTGSLGPTGRHGTRANTASQRPVNRDSTTISLTDTRKED